MCSCSGNAPQPPIDGMQTTTPQASQPVAGPSLEILPPPSLLKDTAAATRGVYRHGEEYEAAWPNRNVAPSAGVSGVYSPQWLPGSSLADAAYAIYRFDTAGFTHDGTLNLDWASRRTDYAQMWVGLADFTRDTWKWYAGPETGRLAFDEALHISGGEMFAAIVCLGELPWELTSISLGQDDGTWVHTWGGERNEWAYTLAVDEAGNVYAAGYTTTFGSAGTHIPVLKYNAQGELQWAKVIDGDYSEERIYNMVAVGDSIYMVGYGREFGPSLDNALTIKMDTDGNLQWAKMWGGDYCEELRRIAVDSAGNVWCTGLTEDFPWIQDFPYDKGVLLKYAPDGTLLIEQTIDDSSIDDKGVYGICIDSSDNVYISGGANAGDFILKLTSAGALDYQAGWESTKSEYISNLYIDSTGLYGSGTYLTGDAVLVKKFDPADGAQQWSHYWYPGGNPRAQALGISGDGAGNIFAVGWTDGYCETYYQDLLKIQYKADGTFVDVKTWGGIYDEANDQEADDVVVDAAGYVYCGGFAPDNNGGWVDVEGIEGDTINSPIDLGMTLNDQTGADVDVTGYLVYDQAGIEDTGGGKIDFLVMKTRNTYSARGSVVEGGGASIAGVVVNISGDESGFAVSAGDGSWEALNLPTGSYTATPSKPGWTFAPDHADFTIDAADASLPDFTGTAAGGTYVASGFVLDDTGAGVPGVKVRITGDGIGETETDATGFWSVGALPDGSYTATPSKAGWSFAPDSRSITISGSNAVVDDFTGTWDDWVHTWGAKLFVSEDDYGRAIAVAPDGSVFVVGSSEKFSTGNLILAYDAAGHLSWTKLWDGGGTVQDALISNNQLYVFSMRYASGSGYDILVLEYDLDGNLLDSNTWGTPSDDEVTVATVDSSGNIYLAGETEGGANWNDIMLVKLDPNGDFLWGRSWGGGEIDQCWGVATDGASVYVSGMARSFNDDNEEELVVLKYSAAGDLLWDTTFSNDYSQNHGDAITLGSGGEVYVAGAIEQEINAGQNTQELAILEFNPADGSLVSVSDVWGGTMWEDAVGLHIDSEGNFLVTGNTDSFFGDRNLGMVAKWAPDGEFKWAKVWGSPDDSYFLNSVLFNNRLFCAGSAINNSGSWLEVFGHVAPVDEYHVAIVGGVSTVLSGTTAEVTGGEDAPSATEDTGGGGPDMLVLRYSASE